MHSRSPELQKVFDEIVAARHDHERVLHLLAEYPDDEDVDALRIGAEALVALGRLDFAEEAYGEVLRLQPGDEAAEQGLALLKLLKAADEAEATEPADPQTVPADTAGDAEVATPTEQEGADAPADAPPAGVVPTGAASSDAAPESETPWWESFAEDADSAPAPAAPPAPAPATAPAPGPGASSEERTTDPDAASVRDAAMTLAEFAANAGVTSADASPDESEPAEDAPSAVTDPPPEPAQEPVAQPETPADAEASEPAPPPAEPAVPDYPFTSDSGVSFQSFVKPFTALREKLKPAAAEDAHLPRRGPQALAGAYLALGALIVFAGIARVALTGLIDRFAITFTASGVLALAVAWPLARAYRMAWWVAAGFAFTGTLAGAGALALNVVYNAHLWYGVTWWTATGVSGGVLVAFLGLAVGLWRAKPAFSPARGVT